MDPFLTYLIVAIIAFYAGWRISTTWTLISVKRIFEELNITQAQLAKLAEKNGIELPKASDGASEETSYRKVEIKVEIYEDQYYAYEVEKDTFVAQARSPEELLEKMIDKYPPGTSIRVDKEKGGDLITAAAAKLKEANEG
jgi:hypothetical protein